MARIAGVDLPRDKRVEVGLTYLYGVGPSRSQQILRATGVSPDTRVNDLTETEVTRIREYIDREFKVEGDLRREVSMNVKRLVDIGAYHAVPAYDEPEVCVYASITWQKGFYVLISQNRLSGGDLPDDGDHAFFNGDNVFEFKGICFRDRRRVISPGKPSGIYA